LYYITSLIPITFVLPKNEASIGMLYLYTSTKELRIFWMVLQDAKWKNGLASDSLLSSPHIPMSIHQSWREFQSSSYTWHTLPSDRHSRGKFYFHFSFRFVITFGISLVWPLGISWCGPTHFPWPNSCIVCVCSICGLVPCLGNSQRCFLVFR
jgi:hypothetical protein